MNEVSWVPARRKIDVDVYDRMFELGLLGERPRVELIEGDLIDKPSMGVKHSAVMGRLTEVLVFACAGRALVRVQTPVRLDEYNDPEPDFSILRRREDFYENDRPGPADVLLLIEVTDSSLNYDRTVKSGGYARAGIREYRIVDVTRRAVLVHQEPGAEGYGKVVTFERGARVALAAMPDIVVDLAAGLG